MYKTFLLFAAVFLLGSAFAQEPEDTEIPVEVREKLEKIKSYQSINGEWTGSFSFTAGPSKITDDQRNVELRFDISDDTATILVKWTPDAEWTSLKGDIYVEPGLVGWDIYLFRRGGLWVEKWYFVFTRVEEFTAELVMLRTVHNWHLIEQDDSEAPNYYRVVADGTVTKS